MARPIVIFLALAAGCAGSSRYMKPVEGHAPIAAPPGQAVIVFIRPSGMGSALSFTILDDKGGFVAQMPSKSLAVHAVAPGKHRFLVWAENTAVMDATVSAGKTYFVLVATRMGMWSARSHLLAIRPGSEEWGQIDEWLAETPRWERDEALVAQWTQDKAAGIPKQLDRAEAMWAKYSDEEKAERTLSPQDGR